LHCSVHFRDELLRSDNAYAMMLVECKQMAIAGNKDFNTACYGGRENYIVVGIFYNDGQDLERWALLSVPIKLGEKRGDGLAIESFCEPGLAQCAAHFIGDVCAHTNHKDSVVQSSANCRHRFTRGVYRTHPHVRI